MAVYSAALSVGRHNSASAELVLYAPTDGRIIVIRDIVLFGEYDGGTFYVIVGAPGPDYHALFTVKDVVNHVTYHWEGRQVLLPGEELWVSNSGALTMTWRISGYILN